MARQHDHDDHGDWGVDRGPNGAGPTGETYRTGPTIAALTHGIAARCYGPLEELQRRTAPWRRVILPSTLARHRTEHPRRDCTEVA